MTLVTRAVIIPFGESIQGRWRRAGFWRIRGPSLAPRYQTEGANEASESRCRDEVDRPCASRPLTGSNRCAATEWVQYSIRINDQWRVCFIWTSQDAMEIEIVDYH